MKNILLATLLLATGLAHAGTATDAAAERKIRDALAHWLEAANRGDDNKALAVWAPDLIGWAPDGSIDTYARELNYAALPKRPPSTIYELKIDEVIVDGSLAVVRDTWTQTTNVDGADEKTETFRSFEVWREQPDKSWKISRWIDGPMLPRKK